jgi:hypothetical protein
MKIEATIEQLRGASLFIGAPMYGGNCSGLFTKSCTDLSSICALNGIKLQYYFLFNESLVQRARNYVTDEFMRSGCTHLMFIDSDIGFDARDVLHLLSLQILDPKYDVITGPYPKKTIAWEKVSKAAKLGHGAENPFELEKFTADFVFNPEDNKNSFNLGEPIKVKEAGTGFMLIPRVTLEKYQEAYPEMNYKPDHLRSESFDGARNITAFFDCIIDPKTKRYLSEDYFFCHKTREAGMSVWMCPWMQINHVGSYIFRGNMAAITQLGVTATADNSGQKKNYKK